MTTCTEGIQLITGDFKNHYKDKNRPETKKLLNILHQHDFTQLITYRTHVTQDTLDFLLISTRGKNHVENLSLSKDQLKDISDHYPISFNLKLKIKQKSDKIIIKSRNLRLLDKKHFQEHLKNNFLGVEFESMPLCSCINAYNYKLQNSLDKIVLVTKKEVNSRPNQPWFNAELRTLKRKKTSNRKKIQKRSK